MQTLPLTVAALLFSACGDPVEIEDSAGSHGTSECGHDLDWSLVEYGFNVVVDGFGTSKAAQGAPLQEGDTLEAVDEEVQAYNDREYARIAAYMMPIRDALMCELADTTLEQWLEMTEILRLNDIKTVQDLNGTPQEQVYSTEGIYTHLLEGEDLHAMMKYLEEAELELKCLAFVDFDFTNPEGENHCELHGLEEGSGLVAP